MELIIPDHCAGLRLDQALAQLLSEWSRSRLQSWILEKRVSVDGACSIPRQKVWGGEKIELYPARDSAETAHAPEAIALDIVHEDNAIIIINKPAGLVVHPGSGNWQGTLLNALLHHSPQLSAIPRSGIVHRLDKETSGLLVVAKTLEAQTSLVRQLQKRMVKRDYLALVWGSVSSHGWVDAPIGRHPIQRTRMAVVASGKEARTRYEVLEQFTDCTLLRCSLETGRTHQIRVHMQSLGHPLVGDPLYGGKAKKGSSATMQLATFPRQALHAHRLELTHPQNDQRRGWEAPLPEDMSNLLLMLRKARDKESHAIPTMIK
ncbi:23S rRNA pseudouridine(1911/1915/1917) synthase RluD [Nitrosospira multiformis]|uniref:23S rRNA pseudouridine(1911/1915/1917) synthase RluD n=1 Tax=Nitrosospira multiformis TaxID=1231 RepID=UPI0009434C30|nr:23S rRNA pseudouridine(1911/1915/1917) synthase RluD [Nitrosospira multiformis]